LNYYYYNYLTSLGYINIC